MVVLVKTSQPGTNQLKWHQIVCSYATAELRNPPPGGTVVTADGWFILRNSHRVAWEGRV